MFYMKIIFFDTTRTVLGPVYYDFRHCSFAITALLLNLNAEIKNLPYYKQWRSNVTCSPWIFARIAAL